MAYTTIDDPSAYFYTQLYTGNGSTQNVVNGGNSDLQPDLVWVKNRTDARWHRLVDSSRGASKNLYSNENDAEGTEASVTAFNSDGFSLGTDTGSDGWNENGDAHVAWQWKCNNGTTSTDTSGDIDADIQANQTSGFSIVTFTSNGNSNQTVPHGLGAAPEVFWVKPRNAIGSWACYFKAIANGTGKDYYIALNSNSAASTNVVWGNTDPTSTLLTIDTDSVAGGTPTMVAYCFKEKQGYSKFGSYTGNGSLDGAFVYTGFKPAWVMIRATDIDEWRIYDNKRANPFNVINVRLKAHTNAAESQDDNECDFLSNGIKLRSNSGGVNSSGQEYIYMAFAESPFVSSKGVPTTAR
jgi:hypothetical protein